MSRPVGAPADGGCSSGGGGSGGSGCEGDSGAGASSNPMQDGICGAASPGVASAAPAPRALPLCFICYRQRRYKEEGFEAMALARGFRGIAEVPAGQLHPEYQEGYRLIELLHDGRLTADAAGTADVIGDPGGGGGGGGEPAGS